MLMMNVFIARGSSLLIFIPQQSKTVVIVKASTLVSRFPNVIKKSYIRSLQNKYREIHISSKENNRKISFLFLLRERTSDWVG
jgi:hypothetical protein